MIVAWDVLPSPSLTSTVAMWSGEQQTRGITSYEMFNNITILLTLYAFPVQKRVVYDPDLSWDRVQPKTFLNHFVTKETRVLHSAQLALVKVFSKNLKNSSGASLIDWALNNE